MKMVERPGKPRITSFPGYLLLRYGCIIDSLLFQVDDYFKKRVSLLPRACKARCELFGCTGLRTSEPKEGCSERNSQAGLFTAVSF